MKGLPCPALEPHSRFVLENGFRLVVKEDHFAPIVAVAVWVGTGSADEADEQCGISHFFEHMFFKGTETRGVGDMDREIKALGGYNNASTSYDFTDYYVVLPSEHSAEAIDIITDALLRSTFPPEEVENERLVILEEIRRQEDSPLGKLSTEFLEAVFEGTPYARPILGRPECLLRITQRDLREYFRRRYPADNMVMIVAGDVVTERLASQIEEIFGPLPPGSTPAPASLRIEPPASPREFTIRKDVEQSYLSFGYPVPNVAGTVDEYALDVAAAMLGEGRSCRYYRLLTEERGLTSFVDCTFSAFRRGGLFEVEAGLEEHSLGEVVAVILGQIAEIARGEFSDREMERAKTLLTTGFTLSNEKASSVAGTLGLYEIMSDLRAAVEYSSRVRRVTREEVCRAAQRYLPPSGYTLGVLAPRGER